MVSLVSKIVCGKDIADSVEDIWCVAEMNIAIIVVCLPALKPLLRLRSVSGETLEIRGTFHSSKDSTANRGLNPHVGTLNEWNESKFSSIKQGEILD